MKLFKRLKRIKLKAKQKFGIFLFVLFSAIIIGLIYMNKVVNPIIFEMSEAKVRAMTIKAINAAVYEVIYDGPIYDEIITISRTNDGHISMISADSLQINKITRELVEKSQSKLEITGQKGIEIPIGSFSGMPIFVGRGPSAKIKMVPIGVISCNFVSEFTEAGINQTNHRIYVNIDSKVSVILPTANQTVKTTTQLMIAESIIVGSVPSTYLYSYDLDEMMNLVPN